MQGIFTIIRYLEQKQQQLVLESIKTQQPQEHAQESRVVSATRVSVANFANHQIISRSSIFLTYELLLYSVMKYLHLFQGSCSAFVACSLSASVRKPGWGSCNETGSIHVALETCFPQKLQVTLVASHAIFKQKVSTTAHN